MKKLVLLVVAGLFILSASTAVAQTPAGSGPEWSVGIQGGWVIPNKISMTDTTPPIAPSLDLNVNNTGLLGFKAGWTPNITKQYFTAQFEYFHTFGPNVDSQVIFNDGTDTTSLKFNTTMDAVFVNFIARYPNGKWHPFVGIGPGWAWVKMNDVQVTVSGTGRVDPGKIKDRASQFAWQVIAGLEYDITRNWSMDLSYRYYKINSATYDEIDLDMKGQSINLGINFKF